MRKVKAPVNRGITKLTILVTNWFLEKNTFPDEQNNIKYKIAGICRNCIVDVQPST